MLINPIISKLITDCPLLSEVRLAYGVSTVEPSQLPVAYIHPTKEEADASTYDNFVVQQLECEFTVMFAVSISSDSLDAVRDQVRNSLLGYVINSDYDAIQFSVGEILEVSASTIWWRDTYMTKRYVRQT